MTSGGARARSGPPPDPNALRRERDKGEWITLPGPYTDPPPPWPLTRPNVRERVLWEREWKRPQAHEWKRQGLETEVGLYVRALSEAEKRGARTEARTALMRAQEHLGLSLPGLARNRWRMPDDNDAMTGTTIPARPTSSGRGSTDTRSRMLRVVADNDRPA